jgi:DNA polymerase III sliding clamp (beta) subunit (PCNA family)
MPTKLSVDRKQLAEAVSAIAPLCKPNSPKEILKYLHFTAHNGTLEVFATNLEQGASRILEADILVDGKFLMEAVPLNRFLNLCGDETVHLNADKDCVTIMGSRSKLKTNTAKATDYPPKFQPEGQLKFTAGAPMRSVLKPVAMASKGPEDRQWGFALDSLCLSIGNNSMAVVCTDGCKMAAAEIQQHSGEPRDILIPLAAMRLIESQWSNGDEVEVTASDNAIYFNGGSWLAYAGLYSGRYPKWREAMASDGELFSATIDQASLKRIVDTAMIGVSKTDVRAELSMTPEAVTITAGISPNECEAAIPCSGKGESRMAINLGYMQSAVASFPSGEPIELFVVFNKERGSDKKILSLKTSSHKFNVMGLPDERPKQSA